MSTDDAEPGSKRGDPRREGGAGAAIAFSLAFVALLASALIWPRPVLWINDATLRVSLPISTVSFLGREAPSWDVVYWAIVGFAVLALFHGRLDDARHTWSIVRQELDGAWSRASAMVTGLRRPATLMLCVVIGASCLATWIFADAPLMAQVSRIGNPRIHDYVRLSNRLGGGGNPPLIVGFFLLSGLALRRPRWTLMGIAMLLSGATAGLLAGALKPLVARSRPDLWIGPFARVWGGESSFPSGHAIAAFAMAGAVLVGSRSNALRIVALLMASSVAATRVVALRHWPSDVLVSGLVGLLFGLLAGKVFVRQADAGSDVEVGEVDRNEA